MTAIEQPDPALISEMELDRAEIQQLRQQYIAQKQQLVGELSSINARCKTRLPNSEFQRLQNRRGHLVKAMAKLEAKLCEMNAGACTIQATIDARKRQSFHPNEVKRLVEMRDRWHEFSMDKTNHQKAREVAWKISQELREFLKPIFANGLPPATTGS